MSPGAKRAILLGLVAVFVLFIAGLVTGAIGAGFAQSDADKAAGKDAEGIIPKPEIHLPAQVILPSRARDTYLDFLDAAHEEEDLEAKGLEAPEIKKALAKEFGERTNEDFETLVDKGPFGRGVFDFSNFVVTNTLLSAWIASLLILAIFFFGTRKLSIVPGRLQNFCEIIVDALLNFVESVIGRERGRLIFPIIATIFLFVLFNAWIGLIPIYQALGFKGDDGNISIHFLRPAGTDLNMPLALALTSFLFVEFLGLRLLGFHYIGKFIRVGSLKRGILGLVRFRFLDAFQGFLDFGFIGPLEAFSELVRVISFTFRLFGNMLAGEILVLMSAFLVSFVAVIGVYGLELLVGGVQALIFAGLTLVFATMAITPHEEEAH